jgi:hypothetical protein
MELAAKCGAPPSGLIMAAISAGFTIGYVANLSARMKTGSLIYRPTCSPKMAASGSTASTRTEYPPLPKAASKPYARSSATQEPREKRRRRLRRATQTGTHIGAQKV